MHTSEIELPRFADYQPTHFDQKGLGSDGQEDWRVLPLCHQPKIATLFDDSNWETAVASIERASKRVQRARRHVSYMISRLLVDTPFLGVSLEPFAHEVAFNSPPIERLARLLKLVDLQPIDGETIAAFAERLDTAIESGPDFEVHYFGHWATDFEIIVVRPGSAAHREAQRITAALSDYPLLDEMDHSQREHEASLENIEEIIGQIDRSIDTMIEVDNETEWPDDLSGEVFSWLWDNEQHEVESRDGNGAYPSRESVERALVALGYLEFEAETDE